MGVLTIRLVESRGKLAGAMVVRDSQQVMLISVNGTATRTSVNGISRMGRNTQGVTVMRLRDGDRLSSVALVAEQPDELEDGENGDGVEDALAAPATPALTGDAEALAEDAPVDEDAPLDDDE
jgi:DNA gyrase subunit A